MRLPNLGSSIRQQGDADDCADLFRRGQRHDQICVAQNVLAVVGQVGANDDLIRGVGDHQAEGDQEIAVGKRNFKGFPEGDILFFVLRRSLHALSAVRIGVEQNEYGYDRVAGRDKDPGKLLVAGHAGNVVDQRQGKRGDDHARGNGQHHADVTDGVAVTAVTGHERAESMERLADRCINHCVHQIVCDKCVNNFADIADIRHGKQQNGCNCIGECEPQDPDTGFAVLGMGSVDDCPHCYVGKTVKHAGNQHDHTDRTG